MEEAEEEAEGILETYFKFLESIFVWENDGEDESVETVSADSEYAEELQVQEVLEASKADIQTSHIHPADFPSSSRIGGRGEASESSGKYCEICMEEKERNEMFKLESCSHCFCSECVSKHIQAKVEDNNPTINCPKLYCSYIIDPQSCRDIIPGNIFARWEEAISQASILESQKFYCPFQDCSAMLVNDAEEEEEVIMESECPFCRRLFCARCRVPWHQGIECDEFQRLKMNERGRREDLMLQVLAKEKNWTKCPNCKFLVDKIEGCIHMTCRCGFEFCYKCGFNWTEGHWSCQE